MQAALRFMDRLDVDVIACETAENGGEEIVDIGAAIGKDNKFLRLR